MNIESDDYYTTYPIFVTHQAKVYEYPNLGRYISLLLSNIQYNLVRSSVHETFPYGNKSQRLTKYYCVLFPRASCIKNCPYLFFLFPSTIATLARS